MLVPRPGMKYMDYPIPLNFTAWDIERALSGALVTKVIYLEDPEKAVPAEVQPDKPVETPEESRARRHQARTRQRPAHGDRPARRPQALARVTPDHGHRRHHPSARRNAAESATASADVPVLGVPVVRPDPRAEGAEGGVLRERRRPERPARHRPERAARRAQPDRRRRRVHDEREAPRDDLERRLHLLAAVHDSPRGTPRKRHGRPTRGGRECRAIRHVGVPRTASADGRHRTRQGRTSTSAARDPRPTSARSARRSSSGPASRWPSGKSPV